MSLLGGVDGGICAKQASCQTMLKINGANMRANFRTIAMGSIAAFALLSGCGSGDIPEPTPTILPTSMQTPTLVPTLTPTLTSTATPAPTPTPLGGAGGGLIIYKYEEILYSSSVPGWYPFTSEISMIDTNGQEKTLFYLPDLEDKIPEDWRGRPDLSLSPDGTMLLIRVAVSRTHSDYYLADTDSGSITLLEQIPYVSNIHWEWSLDSSKLAGIAINWQGYSTGSFVINSDGTGLKQIAQTDNGESLVWSTDSTQIYSLSSVEKFWAIDADGSNKRKIEIEGIEPSTYIECMQFSQDSKKVAFMVTPSFVDGFHQIYVANSDFTDLTLVTEFNSELVGCSNFDWSPDQKYLLVMFNNRCVPGTCSVDYGAYVFGMDTGEAVNLPAEVLFCGWSPDSHLVFLQGRPITIDDGLYLDYKNSLRLMDLSKSNPEPVETIFSACPIAWLSAER
jgi:hypothetical protein